MSQTPHCSGRGSWRWGWVDVVIGGEERNQANNSASKGFQQGFSVEPQPPPGRRRIRIPRILIQPKQPAPIPILASLVHAYSLIRDSSAPHAHRHPA